MKTRSDNGAYYPGAISCTIQKSSSNFPEFIINPREYGDAVEKMYEFLFFIYQNVIDYILEK
ncbi:hypothetical protein [Pedobacter heparinus]|uniref:Uncharacterized protein n=1 Tax=Pedobacter heparinus (strain ATCC 13125 / DSM 2366 / CIP 104194 / JCM 7457 / NBRC 12017 / NCIMB 9290 / NRRL B-14731 / HIM 762-3) TaxID=485917 RepID=C6Y0H9_PEDHD|nr:hypothetical protein [Pedobacter heparinus]ACU02740.1 hypothetical protein Phep_0516 [Pedobacter heparinus DSM 2366]